MHISELSDSRLQLVHGEDFKNGCAVITLENLKQERFASFLNKNGEVFPFVYKLAHNFAKNGLAVVRDFDDKHYYINKKGEKIFGPFETALDFNDFGFAFVKTIENNNKDKYSSRNYKILTTEGKIRNEKILGVKDLGDGYFAVDVSKEDGYERNSFYIIDPSGEPLKDKNGKIQSFPSVSGNKFVKDWILVQVSESTINEQNIKPYRETDTRYSHFFSLTFINKQGEYFKYYFADATEFEPYKDTYITNITTYTPSKENPYTYDNCHITQLDIDGNHIFEKRFRTPLSFHDGIAIEKPDDFYYDKRYYVLVDEEGNFIQEDVKGKMTTKKFFDIQPFKSGYAAGCNNRRKEYQIFNTKGQAVSKYYSYIKSDDSEDLYIASPQKNRFRFQLLDKDGTPLTQEKYTDISPFHNGLAVGRKLEDGLRTYINTKGEEFPNSYVSAGKFCEGFAVVKNTDLQVQYINKQGEVIIKTKTEIIDEESSDSTLGEMIDSQLSKTPKQFVVFSELDNFDTNNKDIEKKPEAFQLNSNTITNDELLKEYVKTGTSVFLHGPSGVGKSTRVKELDPTATRITLRPMMNPEEVDGILDRETGDYIPPLWYTQLKEKCEKEPDRKHILFIDELTNVRPTVQSLVYSIVLDRAGKDGLWPLPENSVVVAAGNETKDNLAAHPLTNALHRRFCHLYYEVDKRDWVKWVTKKEEERVQEVKHIDRSKIKSKIHPIVLSYVMSRQNILNQDLDEENPTIVTDPRKWQIASDVLYQTNNICSLKPAIGTQLTKDFLNFFNSIKTSQPNLSIQEIKNHNYNTSDIRNLTFQEKLQLILSLSDIKQNDLIETRDFLKNTIGNDMLGLFDSLWSQNDDERLKIIEDCKSSDEQTSSINFDSFGKEIEENKEKDDNSTPTHFIYNFTQNSEHDTLALDNKIETEKLGTIENLDIEMI